jgi:hypothetical protein
MDEIVIVDYFVVKQQKQGLQLIFIHINAYYGCHCSLIIMPEQHKSSPGDLECCFVQIACEI